MHVDDWMDEEAGEASPVWQIFGDLMACLFGLFVLFFVWAVAFQVDLARSLRTEKEARASDQQRLHALEHALAGPLAAGHITLDGSTIGIRGSVLFPSNSAELRPEGVGLLSELVPPLMTYLESKDELVMVSGFTDDLPLGPAAGFRDNWELSAERALTVTRALVRDGMPRERIFAAGFGENDPVGNNETREGRAQNRRVEISPIARLRRSGTP